MSAPSTGACHGVTDRHTASCRRPIMDGSRAAAPKHPADEAKKTRAWYTPRIGAKFTYEDPMNILMVLTSHVTLGDTGRKTGFWLEEFAAPYYTFLDAG